MSIPPEVLFHRYFRTLGESDREKYKGKEDLTRLQPQEFHSLLVALQEALNEALRNQPHVPEHVGQSPFHFDYIDSSVPNALAFQYEGYSFIGITIPLIYTLWDACFQLSRSEAIAAPLRVRLTAEGCDALRVVLFRTLLFFVVLHEWTHHVHGHVRRPSSEAISCSEILEAGQTGGIEEQALEADADGYAAYYVLANLITGSARTSAVALLNLDAEPASVQDEVLFSCFVVAVGAFLFVRDAPALSNVNIYRLTHPPQAARMNCLMHHAVRWCNQNRPALEARMTLDRFQMLMSGMAEATLGMTGGLKWKAQTTFLQSEDGAEYLKQLDNSLKAHIRSL